MVVETCSGAAKRICKLKPLDKKNGWQNAVAFRQNAKPKKTEAWIL
jgi:hypothetical protein